MLRLAATRTTTAAAACARTARPCGSVGAATATSSSTSTPVRKDDVVLKGEIAASLAEEHDLSTAQANRIVSGLFDSITENLINGKTVRITGFGKFEVITTGPRMANDFKGGKIAVPETKRAKFRVGQTLKNAVAKS